MRIKKGLEISTSDFWYDLADGGYLKPFDICESMEDANRVKDAMQTVKDFQRSCEAYIDGFVQ